jgi:transcriptional regulator with PAS, ATPase and Fis domain
MKPHILLVSTYPGLSETAKRISKELDVPLSVYEGGILRDGHIYAKKKEREYDVIISQGGTAAVIKEMVKIPVVSIEISTVDLLNALVKAKGYGDKIGLVCHRYENLDALENLRNVLNINFRVFPYNDKKQLVRQIEDATAIERITIVAMGGCITEIAREKHLNSVLITCSESAIRQAIIAAKNICDIGKNEKERVKWLKAVIDYSAEGIVTLNKNGAMLCCLKTCWKANFLATKKGPLPVQKRRQARPV